MTDTSKEAVKHAAEFAESDYLKWDDGANLLRSLATKLAEAERVSNLRGNMIEFDLTPALADAESKLAEVEAERDRQKRRGDNHWETLRSIRDIAKRSGDIDRIIQWVNDAGQGYCETAETTLSKEMDRAEKAEAALATARRDALKEAADVDTIEQAINDILSEGGDVRAAAEYVSQTIRAQIVNTEEGEG